MMRDASPFSTSNVTYDLLSFRFLDDEMQEHLVKHHKDLRMIGDSQTESVLVMRFLSSSVGNSSAPDEFLYFSYRLFTSVIDPELNC